MTRRLPNAQLTTEDKKFQAAEPTKMIPEYNTTFLQPLDLVKGERNEWMKICILFTTVVCLNPQELAPCTIKSIVFNRRLINYVQQGDLVCVILC